MTEPTIVYAGIKHNVMRLNWQNSNGFGQVDVRFVDGRMVLYTETMGAEFVKALLVKLVDDAKVVE
jgi:hypothetical protein